MDEPNPYQSPMAPTGVDAVEPASALVDASRGRRFANFLLDYVFFVIFSAVVGFILAILLGQEAIEGIPDLAFGLSAMLVYYIPLETLFGRTFGKLITGTKVVTVDGKPASLGKIIGRTLARMIPFEPFSFLPGDALRGWHDTLSGTRVVRV